MVGSFMLVLVSVTARAQPYEWRQSLALPVECVAFNPLSGGRVLYAASLADTGIWRTDDGGMSWRQYNEGLQPFSTSRIMQVYCVATDTNVVLAVSQSSGVYRSVDGGRTWGVVIEGGGILGEAITHDRGSAGAPRDILYYGQNFMGPVWRSMDHGATWEVTGNADSTAIVLCTVAAGEGVSGQGGDSVARLLAGSGEGGIALSDDEGKTWKMVYEPEDAGEVLRPEIPKIVWSAYAPEVALATRWLSKHNSIVRTLDGGETWDRLDIELARAWALELDQRQDRTGVLGPQRFWIGLFNRGLDTGKTNSLLETQDAGSTWLSTGHPKVNQVWMVKYDTTSGRLASATDSGLFVTVAKSSVARDEGPGGSWAIRRGQGDRGRSAGARGQFARLSVNPASEFTEVISEGSVRSIRLFDAVGREVVATELLATELLATKMLATKQCLIDVRALPSGAYRVEVLSDEGAEYLPLVVER